MIKLSLENYSKKRNFSKTTEPKPTHITKETKNSNSKELIFVVQEHHARNLHHDFRLEMNGILKSWAVPKGIPIENGIKKLAIETEDHPIAYAEFEGIIEEGNYGAGQVAIWDNGTYEPISMKEKKMVFKLNGKKLNGEYVLLKTAFSANSWLLFKKKEE